MRIRTSRINSVNIFSVLFSFVYLRYVEDVDQAGKAVQMGGGADSVVDLAGGRDGGAYPLCDSIPD